MGARLAAALILSTGGGVGLTLALPLLAGALAPWLGLSVLVLAGCGGVALLVLAVGHVRNDAWRASLAASNERIRLTLEARRAERLGGARDIEAYYWQER